MKILENNFNEVKAWKIVCPSCNSVLEYEKSDVIIHEGYSGYFFYLHYIKCPCCGKLIDVVRW